ncbi:hypothetical protein CEP51_002820 [Fusarium floridanum]|uniref:Peptidase A1 domain-containing protein n=1 Tax=Fusarium floridanum TaxID=1325733 RepID=A0A428S9E9_9HYPO|nr:hypothetical protein CEP51_002820 [Fusarium floridanum]
MFNSTLYLGNELTLKSFPMAQPVAAEDRWGLYGTSPQHLLGVGTESTVLSALKNSGRIASRSVGYYWGLDSAGSKEDTPGSLVFGGYDRAKTFGDGDEMDFTLGKDNCQSKMMISISGLTLNFRNGTDLSLFASSNQENPLRACVVPQNPFIMSLNKEPYFDNLLDAIGSNYMGLSKLQGVDYKGSLLDPNLPWYDGDFTIKLTTGLSITIPNNQLIVPERRIGEDGEIYRNDSQPLLRISRLESDGLISIGRFFFTAAYLASNEDAGKFTIWNANPTTDQALVALDPNNKAIDSKVTCTATPVSTVSASPDQGDGSNQNNEDEEDDQSEKDKDKAGETATTTTTTTTTTPTTTPQSDNGLPVAAIAGIAAGAGATGLICISLLVWWILRRKRRAMGESDAMSLASVQTGWSRTDDFKLAYPSQAYPHFIPQELGTYNERRPPAEMP